MSKSSKLLAATALVGIMSAPALAQTFDPSTPTAATQNNIGNVWSDLTVEIDLADSPVVAAGQSIANTSTFTRDAGYLRAQTNQANSGNVTSDVSVWAGDASAAAVISSSTAIANSTNSANWYGGNATRTRQDNSGTINALNSVDVGSASDVSGRATAVGNIAQVETDFGRHLENNLVQKSSGDIFAGSTVHAGFASGTVENVAVAAGNSSSVFVEAYDDAWTARGGQITADGSTIVASAQTFVGESTGDIVTISAATGNETTVSAIDSFAVAGLGDRATFTQNNGADVIANADTVVFNSTGSVTTAANGVGNSINVSAVRGATTASPTQINSGLVSSDVVLNAGDLGGGAGFASATSIGNSYSAITEGGRLNGTPTQINNGKISASTTALIGRGGITATSTAIGNSAVFENRATNNGQR